MDWAKIFRGSNDKPDYTLLLFILSHHTDIEISSLIYCNDKLSNEAKQACVNVLKKDYQSPRYDQTLAERRRVTSGKFTLLILDAPWLKTSTKSSNDELPLIVTMYKKNPMIAGVIMPFDDLMPLLAQRECTQIGKLTTNWILSRHKSVNLKE